MRLISPGAGTAGTPGSGASRAPEGLVHQQDVRTRGQGAGDGDALTHAAGDPVDVEAGEVVESDQAEVVPRDLVLLRGVEIAAVPVVPKRMFSSTVSQGNEV